MHKVLFTAFGILTLISPMLSLPSIASEEEMKSVEQKACFKTSKSTIYVPYNLTKEQEKKLYKMKASVNKINNMKFTLSLENSFAQCLPLNRTFDNGFANYVSRTLVAYPSMTTYTAIQKHFVLTNSNPRIIVNGNVQVAVGYSPQTGYQPKATITQLAR